MSQYWRDEVVKNTIVGIVARLCSTDYMTDEVITQHLSRDGRSYEIGYVGKLIEELVEEGVLGEGEFGWEVKL